METSARWNAAKEINDFGSNGISNLLNIGNLDEPNITYYLSFILSKSLSPSE